MARLSSRWVGWSEVNATFGWVSSWAMSALTWGVTSMPGASPENSTSTSPNTVLAWSREASRMFGLRLRSAE